MKGVPVAISYPGLKGLPLQIMVEENCLFFLLIGLKIILKKKGLEGKKLKRDKNLPVFSR